MTYKFRVQEAKRIRVIIDTDAACEADDQYAIVHSLLTPKFVVKGIIGEQFNSQGGEKSVDKSIAEVNRLLDLMEIANIPVIDGCRRVLESCVDIPESKGADMIIEEALVESDLPLFVLCQGAITNVAIALRKCPEISGKFTCIWIGGGSYPKGGWEFNLSNDVNAANTVFASALELWQVPMDCYSQMQVSYAELERRLLPCGKVGRYLFDELQEVGAAVNWTPGESWTLGDSPVVGLAMNPNCGRYHICCAPIVDNYGNYVGENTGHKIRVYHTIDSRFILEDFFSKLELAFAEGNGNDN